MGFSDAIRVAVTAVLLSLLLAACGSGSAERFTVTGVITPDALNRVDSDTNDPETPAVRNNDPDEAQAVVAPAIIGGFVAAPGTDSRFGADGDASDVYQVQLQAGQQIILEYPDSAGVDLQLLLLDEDGDRMDASVLPAKDLLASRASLSLVAPEGARFVEVRAVSGLTNYTLRLETTPSLALETHRGPRVSDEFVAGDIIVRTRPGLVGPAAVEAQSLGLQAVAGHAAREQLWRMPEGQERQVLQLLSGWRPVVREDRRWASPELEARYQTLLAVKALRQRPEMAAVSPNFIVRPKLLPDDPFQGLQWFHANIDLPAAWDLSTGRAPDKEMIIAVVDTGVFRNHEDLQGKLLTGYDFIRMQPGGDDPGDSSQPGQSTWHGTHVAGTAAAATDNARGVAGVSWGAKILPVRTLGEGGGRLYDTLQGIRYSAGLANDSGTVPDRPADVINLSLGGGTFVEAQRDLYRDIRGRGIFVIAASGNDGGAVGFPAAYDAVFAVGATDAINRRAPYSSFGPELDFVAPGGDMRVDRTGDGYPDGILSTLVDDASGTPRSAYAFYQGTSMATAVASGVAALARSVVPDLTPDDFARLLDQGLLTDDIEPAGKDPKTGWGQINALSTLRAVRELEDFPPRLSAVPARLDFGFTETTLEFTLRNAGGGSLQVTRWTDSPEWLSVAPQNVDESGLGSYRVDVSREALADGVYEASIVVEADVEGGPEQALNIGVLLRKAAPELTVDTVGRLYVLLVNEDGDTIAEQGVDLQDGRYPYRFERVPAGEYRIVAGTDMNDDRRICDPGEACGAYPILGLFERVLIDRDRSGLDFSVGFRGQPVAGISPLRRGGSDLPRPEAPMRVLP
ncbi:S8 family serine peptidase [Thioalkalivibrio sp.]|uniref:S8 family serine peptidase n=1 Tax=Thioalkalivibrio sp. TaxID=2093813 RepID=UPI0012D62C2C|nr:S8 family serine peptidase [Thioalkalivibrio sp.]TVP78222.1 MAG: peptidase S8 and S53, subtilisin, kexin, sedolisin [Thioalkalivibrio sp.]